MKTEPISIKVDSALKRKLEALAKREVRNLTDQIRKILQEAVEKKDA